MKNFYLISFCVFLTGALTAQKSWNNIDNMDNLLGIWSDQVYTYKDGISIKYTTDGGATEQNVGLSLSVTEQLDIAHYLNANEVFVSVRKLGSGATSCWVSNDGGANFTQQGDMLPAGAGFVGQSVQSLYFFDSQKGLAMLKLYRNSVVDVMMRTSDGGATWNVATTDTMAFDDYEDVIYHRNGLVRVFGDDEYYESTDYGVTWSQPGMNPLTASGELVDDGGLGIWGVGWAGTQKPCYVKSTDGGVSFSSWSIPDENNGGIKGCGNSTTTAKAIELVAPNNILVQGFRSNHQDRVCILSEDGGNSWVDVSFPGGFTPNALIIGTSSDGNTFYCWEASSKDLFVLNMGGGVGISEHKASLFSLFPNPVQGDFRVSLDKALDSDCELWITDLTGKVITRTLAIHPELVLNSEILPAKGMYIVSLRLGNGDVIDQQKLIVQ